MSCIENQLRNTQVSVSKYDMLAIILDRELSLFKHFVVVYAKHFFRDYSGLTSSLDKYNLYSALVSFRQRATVIIKH